MTVATVPWSYTWDTQPPAPASYAYYAPMYLTMPDGMLAVYNQWGPNAGMHLGAINPATGSYQWQAMPALGPLDGRGNFDTNVWYGGNREMLSSSGQVAPGGGTESSTVFVGFNGEGWMGQGQANQFMQFSDDGLFIGEFGTPQMASNSTWNRGYGMAGNSFSPFTVVVNGTTYLYLNDEADRSLQRWHLTGENTIQELAQTVSVAVPAAPTGLSAAPVSVTQINLSWTASSGPVIGYNVYRGTSPGGENYSAPLNGGTPDTATTYGDTTAAAGTTYYYSVEAVNVSGSSAASTEAVIVDGAVLLAANSPLPAGAAVTVTDGGEIDMGGTTAAVASLTLVSGSVVDGTLQVGGGVQVESGTISAALKGGSSLLKTGSALAGGGVATLSGSNVLTCGTVVSGGRLIVTSPAALPNGSSLTVGNATAFASPIATGTGNIGRIGVPVPAANVPVSTGNSYDPQADHTTTMRAWRPVPDPVPTSAATAAGAVLKKADPAPGNINRIGVPGARSKTAATIAPPPTRCRPTAWVPRAARALQTTSSVQRALAYLAAGDSPWPWASWDQQTGPSLAALDAAFARYDSGDG